MKSIKFPGATIEIGKGQPEYNVLHAMQGPNEAELVMCFELSDEELAEINRTKKIYYSRLMYGGGGFQPMKLYTSLDDGIELIEQ